MDDEFRFSKDQPGYSLVAKCAAAGETGELGNLSKADFDAALTSVAKAFADEYGVTFEKAYSAILATPIGSQLYDGYLAAPHAPAPVQKVEPEKVPDAWRAIEKEAAKIRRDEPRLSEPAAIAKVLRQQPHLYDQYEAECGRG
ncbi:MAG TPA: hypothetical protein VGQ49_16785 [Bryobacteraceae bacterium]|nr:hypothetical protein [Bryobacteraceae bacterium]